MHSRLWIRFALIAVLLGLAAVACDESTAPEVEFDPTLTAEVMDSMVATADGMRDALMSLGAAGSDLGIGVPLSADAPVLADPAALQALESADFLPGQILGLTFEFNEAEGHYVPSQAAGAPEDGVRILYYAVDPVTERPASPLNQLGHIDLRDLSTPDSDRLGIAVVYTGGGGEMTLADYYLDVAFTFTNSSIAVDFASVGYLANGTDQLNFDLSQGTSLTETEVSITQSYSVGLEGSSAGMSFDATMTADPQSQSEDPGSMDATAVINNGADEVVMEILWDNEALDGSIAHNGQEVVLIAGTLDEPEFTNLNGDPLTEEQIAALQDIWEGIGDLFDLADGIFSFGGSEQF